MKQTFAFFMWLLTHAAFSQQACNLTISGEVLDQHDRKPLVGAEVMIEGTRLGAVVDSNGRYIISGLCPGKYTLMVFHIGLQPERRHIKLESKGAVLSFYPEIHTEQLHMVTVFEEREQNRIAAAEVKLNPGVLEQAKGKTVADAIENLSGVSILKSGNTVSKPVIHGLYGNRIITMNNGVQQEDQQWGLEHGLNIDLYNAGEISVVKGTAALQYGAGAVGGVVKIDPKPLPFQQELTGVYYLTGQSNGKGGSVSAELGRGIGKNWAFRAQASGKLLGDLNAPDYFLTNTASREFNISLNTGYKFKKGKIGLYYTHFETTLGVLKASHIGNLTDLQAAIKSGEPYLIESFDYQIENPRQKVKHDLWKLEYDFWLNAKNQISVAYAYQINQRQEYDIRRAGRSEIPANFLRLKTHTTQLTLSSKHTPYLKGIYGVTGMIQENTNVPGTGIRPILPNYNSYQPGVYFIEEFKTPRWKYSLGGRYDFSHILAQKYTYDQVLIKPEFNFSTLALIASVLHHINDNIQFSSLVGYTYRPPHVNELLSEGLHHGAASIEEGDITLKPEKSLNWSNTLKMDFSERLETELTLYVNPFKNYIYLEPQPELRLSNRGAYPVYQYKQTDALLTGLDLSMRWTITPRLKYQLTGAYVRGMDISHNEDLVLIPPGNIRQSFKYEIAQWYGLNNLYMEISHHYEAYQNYFPGYFTEIPELFNPPADYHLFGMRAGFKLPFSQMRQLFITASVENLLNTPYRNYMNRLRYYADEPGRNFRLQIKYQF